MPARQLGYISLVVFSLWSTTSRAYYDYEAISQMYTTGRLTDVAFHPSGDYALVVESTGMVFRIEASDWSFSQVGTIADFSIRAVDFNPDGSEALIVGHYTGGNSDEGQVVRYDDTTGALELLPDCTRPGVPLWAVDFTADGAQALVVGWYQINAAGGALFAYSYDPIAKSLSTIAATNTWGPTDASWQPGDQEALITIGFNDAEVMALRPAAPDPNKLLDTDYRGDGSNAQGVDHHPTLGFGLVVDGHQNALKWDWGWTAVDIDASTVGIAFNTDGSRALMVGRARSPGGSGLVGTVVEYTGVGGSFTRGDFQDVSIPGFSASPWGGDGSTYFNAVAFRPGTCEGLMVGSKGVSAPIPFAPIAHFTDIRGADCLQPEPDGGQEEPDAGIEDGGEEEPDAGLEDGGAEEPDAGIEDGGAEEPDAGLEDGGQEEPDAGAEDGDGGAAIIPCADDAECPAGTYCNGQRCTSDCASDSDCLAPNVCDARGRCVAPGVDGGAEEPDAGPADGQDAGADPGADDGGPITDWPTCDSCTYTSECQAGRYCRDGCCVSDCFLDSDCPEGFLCGPTGQCRTAPKKVTECGCGGPPTSAGLPFVWLIGLLFLRRRR